MTLKRRWRPYPTDTTCRLYLPFYKYGSEQQRIWDISGSNNHGTITGAVPYPGNPVITSVGSTFNRGDFTSTNAFFWSSIDLSPYAGTDTGYTPFMIELTDNTGKKATGYIGAVGAGLTLGSELLTNGGMEVDNPPTGWWAANSPEIFERSSVQKRSGDYSARIVDSIPSHGVMQQLFNISVGLYRFDYWYYIVEGRLAVLFYEGGYNSIVHKHYDTIGSWQYDIHWPTVIISGPGGGPSFLNASNSIPAEFFIDDVSLRRVLEPPATAVHIVSSLNGTIRNWASIESGFNPNQITSWRINRVPPRPCMGWLFDGIDDRVVHGTINFSTVHTLIYWIQAFSNAKGILHGGAANHHVAIDETNIYYNAGTTELSQAHGGNVEHLPICLAIRRNGTTVQFFRNGVQIGSNQTLAANNALTVTTLGSYDTPGTFFGGVIHEALGFNTALPVQEIRNYYELTRARY